LAQAGVLSRGTPRRILQENVICYFENWHKINKFAVACTLTVSAYEEWRNIKTNCPQQGVWRQAGRCLVRHFAGFWKFSSRPSLCETPPERQAPDTLAAILRTTAKRIKGINIK